MAKYTELQLLQEFNNYLDETNSEAQTMPHAKSVKPEKIVDANLLWQEANIDQEYVFGSTRFEKWFEELVVCYNF